MHDKVYEAMVEAGVAHFAFQMNLEFNGANIDPCSETVAYSRKDKIETMASWHKSPLVGMTFVKEGGGFRLIYSKTSYL